MLVFNQIHHCLAACRIKAYNWASLKGDSLGQVEVKARLCGRFLKSPL